MSTNDILRKYLDILKEDEEKQSTDAPTPSTSSKPVDDSSLNSVTYAPPKGKGSINAVKAAVGDFQESIGMKRTGLIDPTTLAEILSQSGTIGKDEAEKLQAGAEGKGSEEKTDLAEGVGTSKQQQLMEKACLHEGYAHGLMGHEHRCSHAVGTSEHSHYCHGHQLGLKECGGSWTQQAPASTF
jgi:hypothetical protein